jgi:hypothetical protein
MLDFWDHKAGECAPNPKTSVQRAIYRAADTNLTSSMGSRAVTDVPKCLYLLDGGRICWVQSVRGEEFATPDMQVWIACPGSFGQSNHILDQVQ